MPDNTQPPHGPWEHAAGARFVTPQEFTEGMSRTGAQRGLIRPVVAQALADAADADGVLAEFDQREFFDTYVVGELNRDLAENGETVTPLSYDRFTAFALMDCLHALAHDHGLLAIRTNGETHDYRLCLP